MAHSDILSQYAGASVTGIILGMGPANERRRYNLT